MNKDQDLKNLLKDIDELMELIGTLTNSQAPKMPPPLPKPMQEMNENNEKIAKVISIYEAYVKKFGQDSQKANKVLAWHFR